MKITSNDKILIVAAHPDDEILGCGGLLSKYSSIAEFSILFIAEGETCRFSDTKTTPEVLKKIKHREDCARKALGLFNIVDISFNDLPCGRLDSIDILDINKIIENKILSFGPTILISHYSHDINNDHRIVARSVEMATRPLNGIELSVFSFEVLSSSEWSLNEPFTANAFIQLSERDIQNKIDALKIYDGEVREFPHSRSSEGVKSLSRYRGIQVGMSFAEAFLVNRLNVS